MAVDLGPNTSGPADFRVSDADREQVARQLAEAAGEGRLTIAEADERQAAAYAARFRRELDVLIADLPRPVPPPPGPGLTETQRRRLALHAVLAVAVTGMLVARWIGSGDPYFWPMWPMFWLALSLLVHYRRAHGGARQRDEPVRPAHTAPS